MANNPGVNVDIHVFIFSNMTPGSQWPAAYMSNIGNKPADSRESRISRDSSKSVGVLGILGLLTISRNSRDSRSSRDSRNS